MTKTNPTGKDYLPKDLLSNFEDVLNDYNKKTSVKYLQKNDEIERILILNNAELAGMTPLQCGEAAFLVYQYAAYIQKEYNRNRVRLLWAENHFHILLGKVYSNYGDKFSKYDIVKGAFINDNHAASLLNQIMLHATARCEELKELSQRLTSIGRALSEYQITKSRTST